MTTAPEGRIRVLIADDQYLIRSGLRSILSAEDDLVVVGEAGDGVSAARAAEALKADVVLMDIQMPGSDGIEGVRLLAEMRPEARALVLTMYDLDEYVVTALRAGASGFLLKTTPPSQLAAAIRMCHGGGQLFAPSVTHRLIDAYVRHPPPVSGTPREVVSLTTRELEVYRALATGLSNAEIARQLFLGEATVKSHVTRILAKLGLRDRVQAVIFAFECGLVYGTERDNA
ncbi:response regulator [Mycetocola zhadangensis]|uniref:DNA-binding response regulator n=1 Tax=Mycetocola zhadangensis TaxID=1164595 RepID=A0A3L7J4E1_9MICO|nr:response regulator transcription factor [Mycetocola zhadangensis]RLQ85463.1 DNA-binding response regulator [Mycetocola zhadangensis]GGE82824.1 DNA-binding response regulator [Mycetocola zhadangensis]